MIDEQNYEIEVKESEINLEDILSQDFIPNGLKDNLRSASLLFVPILVENKPYFEIQTQDLFKYFKENEDEDLQVEICISDEEFEYRREESIEEYMAVGWFFLKELVLKPFLEKLKEYLKRKFRKNKSIELKLTVKRTKTTNTLDMDYKGSIDNLERIFDKLKEI